MERVDVPYKQNAKIMIRKLYKILDVSKIDTYILLDKQGVL